MSILFNVLIFSKFMNDNVKFLSILGNKRSTKAKFEGNTTNFLYFLGKINDTSNQGTKLKP